MNVLDRDETLPKCDNIVETLCQLRGQREQSKLNLRTEINEECAPLILCKGHNDDTGKAECFIIEIKNNEILTHTALRPK